MRIWEKWLKPKKELPDIRQYLLDEAMAKNRKLDIENQRLRRFLNEVLDRYVGPEMHYQASVALNDYKNNYKS